MARVESDREDLLHEAVALVRRIELQPFEGGPAMIVGFRSTGWLSIYFGQDRMYQFEEHGRLRRAYVDGLLYRTHGSFLAQLQRQRTDTETILARQDLTGKALAEFQACTLANVRRLQNMIRQNGMTITRQIPADDPALCGEVLDFLDLILDSSEFLAPSIKR